MNKLLVLICWCLATSSTRAGLLTEELSPPTGSSYYSGYGQQNINTGSYSIPIDTYNTGLHSGTANIGIGSTTLGFGAPLQGGFTPLGGHEQYRGPTTSITHQTQSVPIGVPQPYPVTVHHRVPVQVPVAQPVYKPRPVPIEVLQPYPVSVPRPYPVTVAKPVPVPVRHPVYVKVPQAVPVAVPQPYPVHVQPVRVPSQVVVNVPVPLNSAGHGYNTEVGYGGSFGLGAYGQGGYLSGNEYSAPHVSVGAKYNTASFPVSSLNSYSDGYAYKGGFGLGSTLNSYSDGYKGDFGHGTLNSHSDGYKGGFGLGTLNSYSDGYAYKGGFGLGNIGVQSKYTHGLSGGLIDGLKAGRYTDSYKVYKDFGHHGGGGQNVGLGGGSLAGVNLADITIPQQYDADGGYKY